MMTLTTITAATSLLFAMPLCLAANQPSVRVEPSHLEGPRQLAPQTAAAVVRDYLESWQGMAAALEQNSADLLDENFVGSAHDKLADTIHQQAAMGIHTRYQDLSHDLQIVFYSPEGLSIQLVDNVEYDEQVFLADKTLATKRMRARYVVVLTPSEVRWRVRVLQADRE
jgi:hypothetical protein